MPTPWPTDTPMAAVATKKYPAPSWNLTANNGVSAECGQLQILHTTASVFVAGGAIEGIDRQELPSISNAPLHPQDAENTTMDFRRMPDESTNSRKRRRLGSWERR